MAQRAKARDTICIMYVSVDVTRLLRILSSINGLRLTSEAGLEGGCVANSSTHQL